MENTPFDKSSYKTVQLEKIRFGMMRVFSEEFLDVKSDARIDWALGEFAVQVRGYLFGESVKKYTIKYPKDWKQALKEKWYSTHWSPKWAKRKYPVIYTVHHVDLQAVYPQIKVSLPREEHSLLMTIWKDSTNG